VGERKECTKKSLPQDCSPKSLVTFSVLQLLLFLLLERHVCKLRLKVLQCKN